MLRLQTTTTCRRTPVVVFALHQLGLPFELETLPDGDFMAEHLTIGPVLRDGDIVIPELYAILRHLTRSAGALPAEPALAARFDEVFDLYACWALPALTRLARAARTGNPDPDARDLVERSMARVVRLVGDGFVLPEPSVADCLALILQSAPRLGVVSPPAFDAYLARVTALPSFRAALAARAA